MKTAKLIDALDGLFAYDTGATDSGIHDEDLRAQCIEELQRRINQDDGRIFMSSLLRDMFLSDDMLVKGYGYEDLLRFVEWLDEDMGTDLR